MKQIHRGTQRALRTAVGAAMGALALVGLTGLSAVSSRAQDMVPLPLKLPKAAFAGTPSNVTVGPNVEKPTGKPRPIPLVPKGTINLALHKKVTSSAPPFSGSLDLVTDGDKEARDDSSVELKPRLQWIQIDLGATSPLYYIVVWHAHLEPIVYHAVVVQVSDDPKFIDGVTTLFNNDQENVAMLGIGKDKEYFETSEGKLVDAKGIKARYVRLYSKGSTFHDPLNRYTEVEVYGLPAK
jgi:hypothetical protein